MTKQLNVTFDASTSPRFPVYFKYSGQFHPQPAYIYLDLRDGECGADYNGEIGSIPTTQWLDQVLCFKINPETRADDIADLIEKHSEDFQAILDDSSIEWDGNNNRGVFGEKATEILKKLNYFVGGNPEGFQEYIETTMIDAEYLPDWLQGNIFPKDNQSVEEFADELFSMDGENDMYFSDEFQCSETILSHLCDIWAEHLYSGHELPKLVAKHLIEQGTCDDSQWMDELIEFANQD